MIKAIHIKNFKSVVDLKLELGAFNVLIGENGCGKSNILEAIAFGAAASADKLDFEFLGSRGIRATNPEFMFSAFTNGLKEKSIGIDFSEDESQHSFNIVNSTNNPKKWIDKNKDKNKDKKRKEIVEIMSDFFLQTGDNDDKRLEEFKANKKLFNFPIFRAITSQNNDPNEIKEFIEELIPRIIDRERSIDISNYIIYSPEQSSLRKFEETTQIYPLGIKGDGLFQYLKELALNKKNKNILSEVKKNLVLLDWYEDFDLPENLMSNEFALRIKDKYLYKDLQYFDQRSTNEGFLFLLFYATLFISKDTPIFFAIDNIDASFNPKLCSRLIRNLAALAVKNNKQVIVTTHNPAILDGLNLKEDNQRLYVIRRNDEGHTKASRIEYKPERQMKLSEIWTNGFIGGLPENF